MTSFVEIFFTQGFDINKHENDYYGVGYCPRVFEAFDKSYY